MGEVGEVGQDGPQLNWEQVKLPFGIKIVLRLSRASKRRRGVGNGAED